MPRLFLLAALALTAGCRTTQPAPAPPDPTATASLPEPPAVHGDPNPPVERAAPDGQVLLHDKTLTRIAFGSCAGQDAPQPIWNAVLDARPDLFLMIGDNVYADTQNRDSMRAAYALLDTVQAFRRLRETVPVLATWDDHDYGVNDGGAEFPAKKMAQEEFVRFFDPPATSRVRTGEGVYSSYVFGPEGQRVQVILLDTRYFRSLLTRKPEGQSLTGRYVPTDDTTRTLLGEAQWAWLEEQLRQPAELRVVASSIQFLSDQHGWEGWGLMPHERQRFFQLVEKTGARGVLFISGDRHLADISRILPVDSGVGYPIYDVTSSSLNRSNWGAHTEANRFRVEGPYLPVNFGLITIDWRAGDPTVRFEIRDLDGVPVLRAETSVEMLR